MNQKIPFLKMHGAGNDFVMLDGFSVSLPDDFDFAEAANQLCRRHFGVGADGLILLDRLDEADVRMRMWNPDGSEDMCGNGLRCAAQLAFLRGYVEKNEFVAQTLAGPRTVRVFENGLVRVAMGEPRFDADSIPMKAPPPWKAGQEYSLPCGAVLLPGAMTLSTGTAHTVIFLDEELSDEQFETLSPQIEHHAYFPERTSIMWARVEDGNNLRLRIWERGAGETLACGTGACAAAVAAIITNRAQSPIQVHSKGGTLIVEWKKGGEIEMTGPAEVVFEGVALLKK